MTRTTPEAVQLPFDEAVDYFRQKTNMPSAHWTAVMDEAHARAFAVAGATKKALIEDFRQAVDKAISQGTGFGEFKRDFDDIVKRHGWVHHGHPQWRARVIYESNMSTAYAAGRYAQMTRPETLEAFPYWQFVHTPVAHPRIMHLAWNGLTLKADDPWWDTHYPPKGWGCRCIASVVSEGGLRRMGKTKPDTAPETKWTTYVNKTTGVVTRVPEGVDPGWVGNPGKIWKEGRRAPVSAEPVSSVPGVQVALPGKHRVFLSTAEARRVLGPQAETWRGGLTDAQKRAIARPTAANAEAVRDALESAETPEDVAAWDVIGGETLRQLALLDPGDAWRPSAPIGASIVRELARLDVKDRDFLLRLVVPKGTRGATFTNAGALFLVSDRCSLTVARKDDDQVTILVGSLR